MDVREISAQLLVRLDKNKNHPIFKSFPSELSYACMKRKFPTIVPENHLKTLEGHSSEVGVFLLVVM